LEIFSRNQKYSQEKNTWLFFGRKICSLVESCKKLSKKKQLVFLNHNYLHNPVIICYSFTRFFSHKFYKDQRVMIRLSAVFLVVIKNTGLSTTFLNLKNIYSLLHLDARSMILRAQISCILRYECSDYRGFNHDDTKIGNIEWYRMCY
jgi:hypothetical protein